MTEQQQKIAHEAIADVVRNAAAALDRPSAQELKELAESAARAIQAGWRALAEAT